MWDLFLNAYLMMDDDDDDDNDDYTKDCGSNFAQDIETSNINTSKRATNY